MEDFPIRTIEGLMMLVDECKLLLICFWSLLDVFIPLEVERNIEELIRAIVRQSNPCI